MNVGQLFGAGDVIRVKNKHRLNLYAENDPVRQYYEVAFVHGPSLMIVLDVVDGIRFLRHGESSYSISYKVLTQSGIGHISAYTISDPHSYYELA